MPKPALGRGLGALLGGAGPGRGGALTAAPTAPDGALSASPARQAILLVPLGSIRPCPFQPRKEFPDEALRELADSIREQGIVQPLVVRARGEEYELIAGERRWRAARLAGLAEVPVLVRQADDAAALELALIENLQRENLNPLEEAQGYQQLIDLFQLRQEDVAAKVGRGRVVVANALRLLKLPTEVQAYVRNGQLSVGHAKVLLSLPQPAEQRVAAEQIIRAGLNVRQAEDLVARMLRGAAAPQDQAAGPKSAAAKDVHVAALEAKLQERLGTKVNLRYRRGRGTVEIRFFTDSDLERLLEALGVAVD